MRSLPLLLFVSSLVAAAPGSGQEPPDAAIRDAVQKYVAAFNSGDVEAAAATYLPDGSHTDILGVTHHGRAEIARSLAQLLAGPMKGGRLALESLQIRSLTPTVAVEEEAFRVEGLTAPDGQPMPTVDGLCLAVHHRDAGQWLAAAVQCMVLPRPPGAS